MSAKANIARIIIFSMVHPYGFGGHLLRPSAGHGKIYLS
jgi:hypothetical protein